MHSYHLTILILKGRKTAVCQKKKCVANYELLPLISKISLFSILLLIVSFNVQKQTMFKVTTFLIRILNKKAVCNHFQLNHTEKKTSNFIFWRICLKFFIKILKKEIKFLLSFLLIGCAVLKVESKYVPRWILLFKRWIKSFHFNILI